MKRILIVLLAIATSLLGYQLYNTQRVHAQSTTTTRILIPWFTGSDAGYTSLLSISNTSMDPWGNTTGTSGTCLVDAYYNGTHYPASSGSNSLGTVAAGSIQVFTEAQVQTATGVSLANSGQRAYLMVTCNFPYAHAQLLLVNPGGVVTFLPGSIIPPNRSYATGPEQLLQ